MAAGDLRSYLGAARLVRVAEGSLLVVLEERDVPGGTVVHATAAFTVPYRPSVGDQLLVIGDERAFYAIGVLRGRGETSFSSAAGVSLRAEGGRLRLAGDRGVRVGAATIKLEARRLRRLAARAVETFGEQQRIVRERMAVEAEVVDEHASGRWLLQARRVVIKALEKARIKSTTVRVG